MALSELQHYILRAAYVHPRPRIARTIFEANSANHKQRRYTTEVLSRSLERLVDRGLMTGFGHRTMAKWFIESVSLTPIGRREARKLLGRQATLPLK